MAYHDDVRSKKDLLLASKKVQGTLKKFSEAQSKKATPSTKEFTIESNETSRKLRVAARHAEDQKKASGIALRAEKRASYYIDNNQTEEKEDTSVLLLTPQNVPEKKSFIAGKLVFFIGIFSSIVWLGLAAGYIQNSMGFETLLGQQPHILGGFLAGVLAPLALIWMIVAQFRRSAEIERYTSALKDELHSLLFPSVESTSSIKKEIAHLCSQAAELSGSTQLMLSSIHKARKGLRQDLESFEKLTGKTVHNIDVLTGSLEERSAKLLSLTEEIEMRTSNIEERTNAGAEAWDDLTLKVLEKTSDVQASLKSLGQNVKDSLNDASMVLNQAETVFRTSNQEIEKTITASTQTAEEKISIAAKRLVSAQDKINEKIGASSEQLDRLSDGFVANQEMFAESTINFAQDTARLSELLQEHLINVEAIETLSQKSMGLMQKTMEEGASNQRVISEKLQNNLVELSLAAETAEEKAQSVQSAIEQQVAVLKETTKNSCDDIFDIEEALLKRNQEAKRHADEIAHQLTDIDLTISERLGKITKQVSIMHSTIQSSVQELDKAGQYIEPLQHKALKQVGDSIASLGEGLVQIGGIADSVQDNVDKSARRFQDHAAKMQSASKEASIAAEQAAGVFVNKAQSIQKMVAETSQTAEKIQGADRLMRQEMFMGAAKFIVESLHSLSVDLTRAIDGGIHETLWNKYQAGDLTIFTSYLITIKDELPISKLSQKFKKENEFRTFVQSFIHQYEDMVQQAMKVDHAALLGTTFLSSDIGKLYRILCEIAGCAPLVQYQEGQKSQ